MLTHALCLPRAQGAYILNVVVHEDWRGKGIGKALMRAAMHRAVAAWQSHNLYTHVEADNEVAYRLYLSCGFREHSSEAKFSGTATLGEWALLAQLQAAARSEDELPGSCQAWALASALAGRLLLLQAPASAALVAGLHT